MSESGTSEGAGLLIRSDVDIYAGEPLVRVLVAGLIDTPPTPPGVDPVPVSESYHRVRCHLDQETKNREGAKVIAGDFAGIL